MKIIFQPSIFRGYVSFGGILGVSKWLVTPIYRPWKGTFGRRTTLLGGLTITMVIHHLQVMGWSPSIQQTAKRPKSTPTPSRHSQGSHSEAPPAALRDLRSGSVNKQGEDHQKMEASRGIHNVQPFEKTYAHQIFGSFLQFDQGLKKCKKNWMKPPILQNELLLFATSLGTQKVSMCWIYPAVTSNLRTWCWGNVGV